MGPGSIASKDVLTKLLVRDLPSQALHGNESGRRAVGRDSVNDETQSQSARHMWYISDESAGCLLYLFHRGSSAKGGGEGFRRFAQLGQDIEFSL